MDYKINAPTDGDEMIFRHADIFFSCFFNDENHCVHQSREHAMNYVSRRPSGLRKTIN